MKNFLPFEGFCSNSLKLEQDSHGIWHADKETASFPKDVHSYCRSLEDMSWWFLHRNKIIGRIVERFPPHGPIWDIGGGNGFVSSGLEKLGYSCVFVDSEYTGALNAHQRGIQNVICGSIQHLDLPDNSIYAVGLFDVLEHIRSPAAFLQNIQRILKSKPEGKLYITVPVHNWLWSEEDIFAGHMNRFRERTLCSLLKECGFTTVYSSYFFRYFSPAIFAVRVIPYRLGIFKTERNSILKVVENAHRPKTGIVGWVMEKILKKEQSAIACGRISHGASLLTVAAP